MIGKAEGIVLRATDYGESNKILTVFTRNSGKVSMMARGAKKSKSRFTAVSQLFSHGYFLYHGGSGMVTLQQGDLIRSFRGIREDLIKTAYAVYLVEFLDKMMSDEDISSYLFDTLLTALNWMDQDKDVEMVTRLFELKLLQIHGYRPRFEGCVHCGKNDPPFFMSIMEGGFVCQSCASYRQDSSFIAVGPGAVKILRLFQEIHMNQVGNIQVKPETKEQLRKVMFSFIDEYTHVTLKSRRFLEQLDLLNG
ncbi:MAG TPA: DNA repair protein RecO [Paenibacillaceae bacterium]|nr:DNA repair protein RecO [Paenibacillaceae bacterium]